jgi:hypothetical protein
MEVALSRVSVVCRLLVIGGFVMLGRFSVVVSCFFVMVGRFAMMLSCFVGHEWKPPRCGLTKEQRCYQGRVTRMLTISGLKTGNLPVN